MNVGFRLNFLPHALSPRCWMSYWAPSYIFQDHIEKKTCLWGLPDCWEDEGGRWECSGSVFQTLPYEHASGTSQTGIPKKKWNSRTILSPQILNIFSALRRNFNVPQLATESKEENELRQESVWKHNIWDTHWNKQHLNKTCVQTEGEWWL